MRVLNGIAELGWVSAMTPAMWVTTSVVLATAALIWVLVEE
jgi:hypothetical protein